MDPLSASANVLGLSAAARRVTLVLVTAVKGIKDAPRQVQAVLTEVTEITLILSQMQSFLNGETAVTKTGASLVLVEQVIVVLSGCVIMFSELESVLDDLKTECHLDAIDGMRWARNDSIITGTIQRLQNRKASMNLMLTILSLESAIETDCTINTRRSEALDSVDRLSSLVERLLDGHWPLQLLKPPKIPN